MHFFVMECDAIAIQRTALRRKATYPTMPLRNRIGDLCSKAIHDFLFLFLSRPFQPCKCSDKELWPAADLWMRNPRISICPIIGLNLMSGEKLCNTSKRELIVALHRSVCEAKGTAHVQCIEAC